jgi:hypothetical protein
MGELDRAAVLAALREAAEFAASDASLRQIYAVIGALCLLLASLSVFLRYPVIFSAAAGSVRSHARAR